MKKTTKYLVWALLAILFVVMMFCGYKIASIWHQYRADQKIYSELGDSYVRDSDSSQPAVGASLPVATVEEDGQGSARIGREMLDEVSPRDVDFHRLITEVNPEICGWIYCEGSRIDYPVVQHTDNQFYLNHNAKGGSTAAGAIYIDSANFSNFQDVNTIIHGHHLNDGSMFGRLGDWAKQDYFDAHREFYINTPEGNYKLTMIMYFVTPAGSDVYRIDFAGEEDVQSWIAWLRSQSLVSSDYRYQEGDRLVTLSTCMYNFADARGVLIGYLTPISG